MNPLVLLVFNNRIFYLLFKKICPGGKFTRTVFVFLKISESLKMEDVQRKLIQPVQRFHKGLQINKMKFHTDDDENQKYQCQKYDDKNIHRNKPYHRIQNISLESQLIHKKSLRTFKP